MREALKTTKKKVCLILFEGIREYFLDEIYLRIIFKTEEKFTRHVRQRDIYEESTRKSCKHQ